MRRRTDHGCRGWGVAAGAAAMVLAGVLGAVDPRLAAVPLTLFVMACLAAPFLPSLGFFFPVVSRGAASASGVALTFDDGPDPVTTPLLLALLRRHGAHATFFVTGSRAAAYPSLIAAIRRDGHHLGNHTYTHDTLIMLRGRRALGREIDRTREALAEMGIDSPAFRPPVGIVGPDLGPVLKARGMFAVTYSRRALDGGNRRVAHISRRILRRVRPGDIIMLHDTMPPGEGMLAVWQKEMALVLAGLAHRGLPVRPLAEIIRRPVTMAVQPQPREGRPDEYPPAKSRRLGRQGKGVC